MSPRVLITVRGGVAYHVCDPDVEVVIVDFDEVEAGREIEIPANFSDLAQEAGINNLPA